VNLVTTLSFKINSHPHNINQQQYLTPIIVTNHISIYLINLKTKKLQPHIPTNYKNNQNLHPIINLIITIINSHNPIKIIPPHQNLNKSLYQKCNISHNPKPSNPTISKIYLKNKSTPNPTLKNLTNSTSPIKPMKTYQIFSSQTNPQYKKTKINN
jgi:hypothetical protein